MRRALLLAAVTALALAGASAVRADGDPASDFLLTQKVFYNPEEIPKQQGRELTAAIRSANENGYPIRVAMIWSDYDLGAVTALWKKPERYARFLSFELTYYYKGRLLIVMPSGFGFVWPKHDTAAEQATLAKVQLGTTPATFADAGVQAVEKLAAAQGVEVSASGSAGSNDTNGDRLKIVLGVVVLVLLGAGARLLIRRRASG
jgi:hypothetical protein